MGRELKCTNKNCGDRGHNFRVEIEITKYLEAATNVHFTHYPINHFTCACCGLIPMEVTA